MIGERFSVFSNADASPVEMNSVGQKCDGKIIEIRARFLGFEIGARFLVFSNAVRCGVLGARFISPPGGFNSRWRPVSFSVRKH